jgi:riboflavin synthase
MFSGIVEECVRVVTSTSNSLTVESSLDHSCTKLGDSIALDGVCLTVSAIHQAHQRWHLRFDVSPETLRRTGMSFLAPNAHLHLERALEVGGRLHGHLVTGHVDGTLTLRRKDRAESSMALIWELPANYDRYIVEKGSVALAGVSLTVADVSSDSFSVFVVPHTMSATRLHNLTPGTRVTFEIDILARYAVARTRGGIDQEMLVRAGYGK